MLVRRTKLRLRLRSVRVLGQSFRRRGIWRLWRRRGFWRRRGVGRRGRSGAEGLLANWDGAGSRSLSLSRKLKQLMIVDRSAG